MTPFTELMDLILSPLKTAAAQGAENLASGIGTAVQLGLTLYIILYGWQVARGEIAEPWNEFAKRAVKLCIIVALIQGTGLYREYVIDFLAGSLPDSLSNALSNKPIPDASAFDSLANQVAILLTEVWQGTGWSAPAATARAAVVTLLVMPFLWCALIVGFIVTMWAKAGMYFVATLGPLFIALAMFEQTRKYLQNWLDQIVTQIALQVLVALTCGLVMQGLDSATKVAPTPDSIFALAGHVIVLALFSIAIWSSLPRLAMTVIRSFFAALFVLSVAASAMAVELPRQASADGRIRFVDYQPYTVVRIVGILRSSVRARSPKVALRPLIANNNRIPANNQKVQRFIYVTELSMSKKQVQIRTADDRTGDFKRMLTARQTIAANNPSSDSCASVFPERNSAKSRGASLATFARI